MFPKLTVTVNAVVFPFMEESDQLPQKILNCTTFFQCW